MKKRSLAFWMFTLLITSYISAQTDFQIATMQILESEFAEYPIGVAAIVTKGDQILFQGARGTANVELNIPADPNQVFRIGSITKQFTSVAILMLEEQGQLSVQDEITKYLVDYPTQGKKITIEHLLTHTSGIKSYTNMPSFMGNARVDMTPGELIDVFKNEEMEFAPGDSWNYNNSGYILLGAIIEKITGKSYEEFVEKELFAKLGMKNSFYDHHQDVIKNRVSGYEMNDGELVNAPYLSMTLPYAAGSLVSTVGDLAIWNKALWDGKLISAKSLKKAHTPFVLNNGEATDYGYGWIIGKLRGAKTISHGGGIFGFLSQGIYLPEQDIYVAVLSNCNCVSPDDAADRLAALALGDPLEYETRTISEDEMKEYEGVFDIPGGDEKRNIYVEDGKLMSRRGENNAFQIERIGEDKFLYRSLFTTVTFNRDAGGNIVGHTMELKNGDQSYAPKSSEKVERPGQVILPLAVLQRYVGDYELMPEFILSISLDGGQLAAQATGQQKLPIRARSETVFYNSQVGAVLEFIMKDGEDQSGELILKQGGQSMPGKRVGN